MSDDERLAIQKLEGKLEADAQERITWRQGLSDKMDTRMRIDEDHRKYIHDRMHDIMNDLSVLSVKMSEMPCKEHIKTFEYLTNSVKLIYIILGIIVAFIVKVHLGG